LRSWLQDDDVTCS